MPGVLQEATKNIMTELNEKTQNIYQYMAKTKQKLKFRPNKTKTPTCSPGGTTPPFDPSTSPGPPLPHPPIPLPPPNGGASPWP